MTEYTAVQFIPGNLRNEAQINQLLGELVSFDALMWFNRNTAAWEPFEVSDWFVGLSLDSVIKMDPYMFERLYGQHE